MSKSRTPKRKPVTPVYFDTAAHKGIVRVPGNPVLDGIINSAESGNWASASNLLEMFAKVASDSDPALVDYVAKCMALWAKEGFAPKAVARAFRLSRRQGRPKNSYTKEERDVGVVATYLRLRGEGKRYGAALGKVKDQYPLGEKAIEALIAGVHDVAKPFTQVQLQAIRSLRGRAFDEDDDPRPLTEPQLRRALGGGWEKWLRWQAAFHERLQAARKRVPPPQ